MEPPSIDLPEIMEPIPENVSRKLSLNTVPTALLHTMSVTLNSVIEIVPYYSTLLYTVTIASIV